MYDLVVHFGAPKTGSSAIQYFLLQNRMVLEQCGYYYPPHGHDRNAVSGGHSGLGVAVMDKAKFPEAQRILTNYLHDARRKGLKLLISAESLYGQMATFKKLTGDLKVKVIGFYRDPLESLLSGYNQMIKRSFMTSTLTTYCQSLLPQPSVGTTAVPHEKWAELFGDEHVSILPYDTSLFKSESIEWKFLAVLGITAEDYSKFQFLDKPINGSYSQSALTLKRLLNLALDRECRSQNDEIDHCLQHYSDHHPERKARLSELIPPDVYGGLIKKFRGSNDAIRARFFPDANISFLTDQEQVNSVTAPFAVAGDYSVAHVANIAFAGHDQLVAYIKQCIADYCESGQQRGFEQYTLANLAGLTLQARRVTSFLNAKQIERLTGEKMAVPQMLRELALAHETMGDSSAARKFIDRACELRPESVPLQQARDRILKMRAQARKKAVAD